MLFIIALKNVGEEKFNHPFCNVEGLAAPRAQMLSDFLSGLRPPDSPSPSSRNMRLGGHHAGAMAMLP